MQAHARWPRDSARLDWTPNPAGARCSGPAARRSTSMRSWIGRGPRIDFKVDMQSAIVGARLNGRARYPTFQLTFDNCRQDLCVAVVIVECGYQRQPLAAQCQERVPVFDGDLFQCFQTIYRK